MSALSSFLRILISRDLSTLLAPYPTSSGYLLVVFAYAKQIRHTMLECTLSNCTRSLRSFRSGSERGLYSSAIPEPPSP